MKVNIKNKYVIVSLALLPVIAALYLFVLNIKLAETENDPENIVLAKVGDLTITVHDFRMNYEFGLPNLKTGATTSDRKLAYLNYMINEKVLAAEGYKLGLENSEQVKKQLHVLSNELAVQALIEKDIEKNIKISEQQIRDAVNKSKVSFKFRFWVEPSLERARSIAHAMKKFGYADVVDEIVKHNPEFRVDLKNFQTDYVSWIDVNPEVLEAISNLPTGDISDPVIINGSYFIFQVLDIRRSAVTQNDYLTQAPTIKKILYNRELNKKIVSYVDSSMTPKRITTKARAFGVLANAFIEWKKDSVLSKRSFTETLKLSNNPNNAFKILKSSLRDTMVKFVGGYFTVQKFLEFFDPSLIKTDHNKTYEYKKTLNEKIATVMRDYFLAQEAYSRKLIDNHVYLTEIKNWKDKWIYQTAREVFLDNVKITDDEVKTHFTRFSDKYKISKTDKPLLADSYSRVKRDAYLAKTNLFLKNKIDSLKNIYKVEINFAVLDTITVTDFKKSRWAGVQLFKGGTGRQVIPIVDAAWNL